MILLFHFSLKSLSVYGCGWCLKRTKNKMLIIQNNNTQTNTNKPIITETKITQIIVHSCKQSFKVMNLFMHLLLSRCPVWICMFFLHTITSILVLFFFYLVWMPYFFYLISLNMYCMVLFFFVVCCCCFFLCLTLNPWLFLFVPGIFWLKILSMKTVLN